MTSGLGLAADGNNDGVVNTADYALWRDNVGASSSSRLSAPTRLIATSDREPTRLVDDEAGDPAIEAAFLRFDLPAASGTQPRVSPIGSERRSVAEDFDSALLLLLSSAAAPEAVRVAEFNETRPQEEATETEKPQEIAGSLLFDDGHKSF